MLLLLYPRESIAYLIIAFVILVPTTYTLYKVHHGSQSPFAYKLLFFSLGFPFCYVAMFMCNYVTTVDVDGNVQKNFYSWFSVQFIYMMLLLQNWVFAMQYIRSAHLCDTNILPLT